MRHPFDRVLVPETSPDTPASRSDTATGAHAGATRRSVLGFIGALVGAATGLLGTGEASAASHRMTTQALGEEGGRPRPVPRPPGHGGYPPPGHGGRPPGWARRVTTQALGEEGGRWRRPRWHERDDVVTTYALGEEGGRPRYPRW